MIDFDFEIHNWTEFSCLEVTWRQSYHPQNYKESCLKILDLVQQSQCRALISDTHNISSITVEDQRWTTEDFEWEAFNLGIKYYALIPPGYYKDKTLIQHMVTGFDSIQETQIFMDRDQAMQWVKGLSMTSEYSYLQSKYNALSVVLGSLSQYSGLGYWEKDFVSQQTKWSETMFDFFFIKKESYQNLFVDESEARIFPEDLKKLKEYLHSSCKHYKINYRVLSPKGHVHYIMEHGVIERDSQQNPITAKGICEDITHHIESQKKLEQEKKLFDSEKQPMLILNQHYQILSINKSALELLAESAESIENKSLDKIFISSTDTPIIEYLKKTVTDGNEENNQFFIMRHDRENLPVCIKVVVVSHHESLRMIVIIQNLEQKMDELKTLICTFGHHISSPLSVIQHDIKQLAKELNLHENRHVVRISRKIADIHEFIIQTRNLKSFEVEDYVNNTKMLKLKK